MPDIEMRRVINGKVYDTTKSTCLATLVSRGSLADFEYEHTQLYRTNRGNLFLAGCGGAWSRWQRRSINDDGWVEGCGIKPIDQEEARKLVELHANGQYLDIFTCEEA